MHTKISKHLRNIPRLGLRLAVFIALMVVSLSSGLPASAAPANAPLAAPRVVSVSVAAQTGTLTTGTAGSATYIVTVTKANSGTNNTNNTVTANLSVSAGLPTGATASFSPASLTWNGTADTGAKTSTLTINTTAAVPSGSSTFTVSAVRQGVNSDNASGTQTLTINRIIATIIFGAAPTPTYLGGNFTVSATTNSNGALTYSVVSGPCALVSGATFSSSGGGTCVVRASTPATANFLAGSAQQSITIARAIPTVTFGAAPTPIYLGGNFTVAATTNSDGALTYSAVSGPCALVSGATFSSSGAGVCVVRASTSATANFLAGSAQQSITIAPATPILKFGSDPYPFFPGGDFTVLVTTNSDGALTFSYVSGPCTLVDANLGIFTPTGLGSCVVQVVTAATSNFLAASAQQSVTIVTPGFDLYAVSGSTTLPDGTVVPVWGYNNTNAAVTRPGGPTLVVNQGDVVAISLHNNLPNGLGEATGLLIQGQVMVPDRVGAPAGGSKNYLFTADHAGTYLYEAGLLANAQHQVAMGLYGVLIVRPATANQAYSDLSTLYNDEAVVLLSELDPALNTSATPANFDMRNYSPKYWLINGKAYPQTDAIATTAGNKVLLRYANAGLQHHSMTVLGLNQMVIAQDGSVLTFPHRMVAETIAPGQTVDVITTIPSGAAPGSKFALYDGNRLLHNSTANGVGGMLTFLTYGGTVVGDVTGPTTGGLTLTPNAGNLDVTATVDDSASGAGIIQAAEYYIDSTANPAVAMTPIDTFDTPTEGVKATISAATLASLSAGSHTLLVRGRDAANNWGAFALATIFVDHGGPTTSKPVLSPNPSNGNVVVAVSATADDSATGNSNIIAAQYTLDGGAPQPMTVNNNAPIASLTASIPASNLTQGVHAVAVRSQDALGNWGTPTSTNLLVDKTGPTTSAVSVAPNSSNGTTGLSDTQLFVEVTATFDDVSIGSAALDAEAAPDSSNVPIDTTASNHVYLPLITAVGVAEDAVEASAVLPNSSYIKMAEGFIDTLGANGTGFPFAASDGLFDSLHEVGYADIPLATIAMLSTGNHTIYVHAQDGVGNWGAPVTLVLKIDKQAPTVSGLTLTPAATNSTPVVVSASATDVATGNTNIGGGEFFVDDNTGAPGTGTAMTPAAAAPATTINGTIPTATLATLTEGTHTVYVRAKDVAGNWSALINATLRIDRTPPTFSGITLNPNAITVGTATVNLTVNGSNDAGGSGVVGGEYWFGTSNIITGTGTAFTGLTNVPIATGSLAAGTYTVRVRIRDAAGNWSTGTNGVRTATLTVVAGPPDAIFSDGFESGNTNNWSSRSTNTTSRLNVTNGTPVLVGTFKLQAQGNNTNYVQYNFGTVANPATATFDARFYFNPNSNTGNNQDIFVARTTGGTTVFRVRYRLNGGARQVQIQVGTGTGNGTWTGITNNASNRIEVVWQSGIRLQLYVNGTLAQTLTANTNSVGGFRLGSVTSGGNSTLEYFDAFAAKRSISPLIGP